MSDSVQPHRRQPTRLPSPGILQARTLEWVAISFSNAWRWKNKVKSLSCVRLLVTPWTAAHQAPLSMGFSRQEASFSSSRQLLHKEGPCNQPEQGSVTLSRQHSSQPTTTKGPMQSTERAPLEHRALESWVGCTAKMYGRYPQPPGYRLLTC